MNANFDGDFRRRPQQNLSGASSKLSRTDVIQKAQQERQKRESQRQQLRSTLLLQSYVRSYLIRCNFHKEQRIIFEQLQQQFLPGNLLDPFVTRIIFFYDATQDVDKLVWLCKNIIKQKDLLLDELIKNYLWRYRIQCILYQCLQTMLVTKTNATLLRILDIFLSDKLFTNPKTSKIIVQFYTNLTQKRNFYEKTRLLMDNCLKIESNPTLFTEISNFLIRPIALIHITDNIDFRQIIFSKLCSTILCTEFTDAIKEIFLINLLNIKPKFPYSEFYAYLVEHQAEHNLSVYLFFSILKLVPNFSTENELTIENYLNCLAILSENIRKRSKYEHLMDNTDDTGDGGDNDDDDEDETIERDVNTMELDEQLDRISCESILRECLEICNDEQFVNNLLMCLLNDGDEALINNYIQSLAQFAFNLLTRDDNSVQKYKILYMLGFKPNFLRSLWFAPGNKKLLDALQKGVHVLDLEYIQTACLLSTFCELFNMLLTTLHDDEFWTTDLVGERHSAVSSMPFTMKELETMCEMMQKLVESLIELTVNLPYQQRTTSATVATQNNFKFWYFLYKSSVKLITNLYQKDTRIHFGHENLWSQKNMFNFPSDFTRLELLAKVFSELELDDQPPLTVCESRWVKVLRDLPFLLPFTSRVMLFRGLVYRLRIKYQVPERIQFQLGPNISITVRRQYIYEDAYLKLQDADLRQQLRVQFVNAMGLAEAGIDGGGILREFLAELLTTCFDPNRGYFKLNRANLLYPNPNVHQVEQDFARHYYFIGKILGKAIYENIQVELPLAEFFLTKLVSKKFDVDFHYLASLDQTMYKSMLFLKNYQGNVQDLGLDFTIVNEELGETRVDELKANGNNIAVTTSNRIEYIHLLADYKMNKQIRQQCLAFKQGLNSVLQLSYLQIFSNKELQLIISGADYDVDIHDLKQHTNYTGDRTADHPIIKAFWQIVEGFTSLQKRQLLKFVTSCSRPPLLGFKELQPAFSIQLSDGADRLPTASTCLNLLKIPAIPDPDVLKERLLYAISQGAGFELS